MILAVVVVALVFWVKERAARAAEIHKQQQAEKAALVVQTA
jgi:hypothetical protein